MEPESHKRPRSRFWGPFVGVTAVAFVLLVLIAPMVLMPSGGERSALPSEDMDGRATTDDVEMLRDLEFYASLAGANALPDEMKRSEVQQRDREFQKLPRALQQNIRDSFRRFRALPSDEREALRQRWQELPASERQQIREQLQREGSRS